MKEDLSSISYLSWPAKKCNVLGSSHPVSYYTITISLVTIQLRGSPLHMLASFARIYSWIGSLLTFISTRESASKIKKLVDTDSSTLILF